MLYKKIIKWLPRILAIAYILFLGIFAFDVFSSNVSIMEIVIGLFIHLLPNFILLLATLIAWKRETIGGIMFIILGITFTFFFTTYQALINFALVSLPAFVIGLLFIISARVKR